MTATIWQRAGLLVGYLDTTDPAHVGRQAVAHGFGWVAPKLHDGQTVTAGIGAWIAALRAAAPGVLVGGWGVQQYDPGPEARLAATLSKELQLGFYIADAEGPYKSDYRMPDGTMGVNARAATFTGEFRRQQPTLPAALTTFGAGGQKPDGTYWQLGDTRDAAIGPMDFRCWYQRGFRFLPQAYPNEAGPVYSVPNCVQHALQCGWPRSLVHPMLGCYPSHHPYDPVRYVAELHSKQTIGFSVFLAETMTDTDWRTLGSAIGTTGVAR